MGKTNKLTIYIFAAMILGVLTGYVFNRFGGGHQISYTPKADFTGKDTVLLQTSHGLTVLPLFIAKDSADLKNAEGIFSATEFVLAGKSSTLTTEDRIETIEATPKNGTAEITAQKSFADYIKLLSTIFIRLVQMIISPLVFTTLVVGIAKLGDVKTVGRVGGKAILWFITASVTSLLIGLLLVNFFKPGQYISLSQADISGVQLLKEGSQKAFTAQNFIEHVVPKSFIEAMANNEMLQLVIFSVFFGIAASAIGDYTKPLIKGLEIASHIILKMVNYVMNFAPLGVFGAIAAIVATKGLGIFNFYFKYFSFFLLGIACLWAVLLLAGF